MDRSHSYSQLIAASSFDAMTDLDAYFDLLTSLDMHSFVSLLPANEWSS